jgi:hypothetical protein
LGVRIVHQQQKRIIVSDIFLVLSALVCLGLIICEYCGCCCCLGIRLTVGWRLAGDTLTYQLGAMKPETTGEETVTADALAKQVALDKVRWWFPSVGDVHGLRMMNIELTWDTLTDLFRVSMLSLPAEGMVSTHATIILQSSDSADLRTDMSFNRSNYFYDYGMYFPKFTILALYFELFPNTMPNLRMSLYITTAFTVMCSCTTLGLITLWCKNVTDNWSTEPGKCSSFNSLLVLQIDWAMNFFSDVASKLPPWHLSMPTAVNDPQLTSFV